MPRYSVALKRSQLCHLYVEAPTREGLRLKTAEELLEESIGEPFWHSSNLQVQAVGPLEEPVVP